MPIPGTYWYGKEEMEAVMEVMRGGYLFRYGNDNDPHFLHKVSTLGGGFAKYCGANYALATSSGTSALLVSLIAMGLKPEGGVMMPAFYTDGNRNHDPDGLYACTKNTINLKADSSNPNNLRNILPAQGVVTTASSPHANNGCIASLPGLPYYWCIDRKNTAGTTVGTKCNYALMYPEPRVNPFIL